MAARGGVPSRPRDLRHTLRALLAYMGHARVQLLAVAVLVTASGLAALLGTYMIKPVVNAVGAGDYQGFVRLVILTAAIYALGSLAAWGYTQTMVRAAQRVVYDIRRDLLAHIESLPLSFFDRMRNGDIMSYFTNDVDTISEALNNSFANAVQALIQTVGTFTLLVVLDWRLTLITLACDAAIALYVRYSGHRSGHYFAAQQQALGELDGYVEEMMSGQKVVKTFNHEAQSLQGFDLLNGLMRESGAMAQGYASTMIPVTVAVSYVNIAIVTMVGALLAMGSTLDVGALASYLVFVRQAAMPINQLTQQGNFLLTALAGAERVFAVLDCEGELDRGTIQLVRDDELDADRMAAGAAGWGWHFPELGENVPLAGDVRFYDVAFGYDEGQTVLEGLSLFAKPGQKIAFVGSTGAGKTTLVNLLMRFYEIGGGRILLDGKDTAALSRAELRRSFGMVLQDAWLFAGTVGENIAYGKPDAPRSEIVAAAKAARADFFIRTLPQGYDTVLKNDAENISAGQRQLLTIARVFLCDPAILILDEATSSVDTRTEIEIGQAMKALMKGRTSFVIAHRLSTIVDADLILVMHEGGIIEQGDHRTLLAAGGAYAELYNSQFA